MAKFIHYRCPDCGGCFRYLHERSDTPPPNRCLLCRAWMSDEEPPEAVFVPQSPGIRKSPLTQSVDQTYREMERSSIDRAREAADMAGVSETEMSHMKITNMRDPSEMREGDTAAIMPPTQAAGNLSVGVSRPGFQSVYGGKPPDMAPGVGGGNQSLKDIQATIAGNHRSRAAGMIRAGNMGSDNGRK